MSVNGADDSERNEKDDQLFVTKFIERSFPFE